MGPSVELNSGPIGEHNERAPPEHMACETGDGTEDRLRITKRQCWPDYLSLTMYAERSRSQGGHGIPGLGA